MKLDQTGYFGIGIYKFKRDHNLGLLWRSAFTLGASYIFTIGKNYKKQASDVFHTWARIPLFQYETMDDFLKSIPYDCRLIGIEIDEQSEALQQFEHPKRAVYLLGSEDAGLPLHVLEKCHYKVQLPGKQSLNVGVTGSIVMYDRVSKIPTKLPELMV